MRSRWKLELKIVCTSNLNTTNQSAYQPTNHPTISLASWSRRSLFSSKFLHLGSVTTSIDQLIWNLRYHLKDVIVGRIFFLLVRIKIKHMELSIIRRETTGAVPNQYNESETIVKFEIMDGAPAKGACLISNFIPPENLTLHNMIKVKLSRFGFS